MKKIFIVDDEEWARVLYADELSEEGYEVISSEDGSEITKMTDKEKPDLIVLDVRLREHNGLDLLQDIRNRYSSLPVIICTGYPAFKSDLKSTASVYSVVKSSDLTELKLKIKAALGDQREPIAPAPASEISKAKPVLKEQMEFSWQVKR